MENVLNQFQLHHRIAVITGGAGLLGQQYAKALLQAGGQVALLDIHEPTLQKVTQELKKEFDHRIRSYVADVTQANQIYETSQLIERDFGESAQILINNAALDPKISSENRQFTRLEGFSIGQWNQEIAVGLTGALICSQVFGTEMAKRKKGVILNIASDLAIISPDQRLYQIEGLPEDQQPVKPVTYSVIKHGLIGLTKYLATYWASQGVRCNALAPGGVFNNHPDSFVEKLAERIPMGRMAHLSEYQAALLFLVSDASSYMNGATLTLDGGRSIW